MNSYEPEPFIPVWIMERRRFATVDLPSKTLYEAVILFIIGFFQVLVALLNFLPRIKPPSAGVRKTRHATTGGRKNRKSLVQDCIVRFRHSLGTEIMKTGS
jgi:hypothetical protein